MKNQKTTKKLIDNVKNAGLISESAALENGSIWKGDEIFRDYELIKKEEVLKNLAKWKDQVLAEMQEYQNFTSPFKALSPYGIFEGYSANFLNWQAEKQQPKIQKIAEEKLKPWLHCPKSRSAAIHIFETGERTISFCAVKYIDEIVSYWENVIEELFSFVETDPEAQGLAELKRQTLNKRFVLKKGKNGFKIAFAGRELECGKLVCGDYINELKMVCRELNLKQFRFEDNRKHPHKNHKIKINLIRRGDSFWKETKNGLKDFHGKPILVLEGEAGGWFMKPKGGFPGVANPDRYLICQDFEARIVLL